MFNLYHILYFTYIFYIPFGIHSFVNMTDLFNQFEGALSDFKMRNIDSAGLHEIIGEFAPLIGVESNAGVKVKREVNDKEVEENAVKVKIKEEPPDEINEEIKPGVYIDTALDLSVKPSMIKPDLNMITTDGCQGITVKTEPIDPVTSNQLIGSIKREPSDSLLIDQSVYKRSRHSFDGQKFELRNSCSPDNFASEKVSSESTQSSAKSNRDSDDESSKACKLLYEIKSVNDLKYYQCKLCPKVYDTKYHLNRHLISHGGNRPHCCDKCGKSFSQKCDLNRHMNVHNNLRKHACSVCGKTFKRADYLSKHERQYCGVYKPHKCTKCYKGFEELEQLNEHSCIQRADGTTFTCEHCSEKFDSVDSLVEHRKTHKNPQQDFQCTKCKEEFTDFGSYVDHFKKHSGERPYSCDLCQKIFTRNHNLMTHMWIHNQEKQHTCHICAKTFTYYSNLQVHLRVHRNERPYKCNECDKGFLTSSDLRRHQRTHSGEKPYKCEQCPAEYARKERLISHMITHMEEGVEERDMMGEGLSNSYIEIKVEVEKNGLSTDEEMSRDSSKGVREGEVSEDSSMMGEDYYAEEEN